MEGADTYLNISLCFLAAPPRYYQDEILHLGEQLRHNSFNTLGNKKNEMEIRGSFQGQDVSVQDV